MMTKRENLEAVFERLCAEHDLTVCVVAYRPRWGWDATVHWDGYSIDGLTCASDDIPCGNKPTPHDALMAAIAVAKVKRTAPAGVPALEMTTA